MNLVFLGTPDFAVPVLENLINSRHKVLAAVTQPDRKRDRNTLSFSPVKECALKHGVEVLQYEKVSRDGIERIRSLKPDVIITAAFGQMLSREFLEIAPFGVLNVHASLLPAYRGSSPIQWTVVNGERETGVTIMKTAFKMDSGDIILQRRLAVGEDETAGELFPRLSVLGAEALIEALDAVESGTAVYTPQDEAAATYYPMLKKGDGLIDFKKSAKEIKQSVQGFTPWPSAFTYYNGKMLKIIKVGLADGKGKSGEVLVADPKNGLVAATADGALSIEIIQPENGRKMSAKDYLLGHKIPTGVILGE